MAFASLGVNALRIVVEGMKRKDVRLKYIKKKKLMDALRALF